MFSLRIDIDTFDGLKNGIPKILDILADYDMKVSFYCIMGREGDLFNMLKYKIRSRKFSPSLLDTNKLSVNPSFFLKETLHLSKIFFYPRKVSLISENLKRIKKEAHEIGPHGYTHIKWSNITSSEMRQEFKSMIREYQCIFKIYPKSWSAPFGVLNKNCIKLTEEFRFDVNSYLGGSRIFRPIINGKECHHIMVPVTIEMTKNHLTPLQYFQTIGLSDGATLKHTTRLIDKQIEKCGWASTYIHSEFEGLERPDLFRQLIKYIYKKGYVMKTFLEVSHEYVKGKYPFVSDILSKRSKKK